MPFSLRRQVWPSPVVELAADDVDALVAFPPRCLRVVGGGDRRLAAGVRAPAVNADRDRDAGAPASARDQVGDPDGVGNAPVQLKATVEQAPADQVDVLEVKEDRDALSHCCPNFRGNRKTPPVPWDGGE